MEKAKLLKLLYQYKAMGYKYFDDVRELNQNTDSALPSTIIELRRVVHSCHICNLSKTRKNVVLVMEMKMQI